MGNAKCGKAEAAVLGNPAAYRYLVARHQQIKIDLMWYVIADGLDEAADYVEATQRNMDFAKLCERSRVMGELVREFESHGWEV